METIKKMSVALLGFLLLTGNSIYAVGGKGTTEVKEEEAISKGVVKVFTEDGRITGSAFLFDQGKGQLGITAKHNLVYMDQFVHYAQFGTERRKILRVFSNKNNDISLFVVETPFSNVGTLPKIIETLPSLPFYMASFYGFGLTESDDVLIVNSGGTCRKNDISFAPLNCLRSDILQGIKADINEHMRKNPANEDADRLRFNPNELLDNYLISVRDYGVAKLAPEIVRYFDDLRGRYSEDQIPSDVKHTLARDKQRLALLNSQGFPLAVDVLPVSTGVTFEGDSGGPLIDKDNNIYGFMVRQEQSFISNKLSVEGSLPETTKNCRIYSKFQYKINDVDYGVSVYVDKFEGVLLYVEDADDKVREQILMIFYKELRRCFSNGKAVSGGLNFFQSILQQEQQLPEDSRWFTNLCSQFRPWSCNYFISVYDLREWIQRATQAAHKFLATPQDKK